MPDGLGRGRLACRCQDGGSGCLGIRRRRRLVLKARSDHPHPGSQEEALPQSGLRFKLNASLHRIPGTLGLKAGLQRVKSQENTRGTKTGCRGPVGWTAGPADPGVPGTVTLEPAKGLVSPAFLDVAFGPSGILGGQRTGDFAE